MSQNGPKNGLVALTVVFGAEVTLQKKAIRNVVGARYNSHTDPIFKRLNLLKLPDVYKIQCCKLMYKKKLGTLHQYHSSLLKSKSDIHDKSTRQQCDIDMSKST